MLDADGRVDVLHTLHTQQDVSDLPLFSQGCRTESFEAVSLDASNSLIAARSGGARGC